MSYNKSKLDIDNYYKMNHLPSAHTVHVFTNNNNRFGNPLGIIEDEKMQIDTKHRQQIATKLNYSETVFINNRKSGNISIFSPIQECPFSMYAALGVAWYIKNKLNTQINELVSKDQRIIVSFDAQKTWVRSKISILPDWNFIEYQTPNEIESLQVNDFLDKKHVMVWAWIDKQKGMIRARTFASDWGIPEDEANGSGAIRLADKLQKNITIIHGKGSIIYAKPIDQNYGKVGGQCYLLDKTIFINTK